jgi:hypothetical protein
MNAPIQLHIWGQSRAVDRIWSRVSGLAPSQAGRRLFLVLQAFIDDSSEGDIFALGGYIASAESWAAFSKEWEEILHFGVLNKHGKFHFKMVEMAWHPERMKRVPAFYRVIENHALAAISCAIDVSVLKRAAKKIKVPNAKIDWGYVANPYIFTFLSLLDAFYVKWEPVSKFIPIDDKIDFYFDVQTEKKFILPAWDEYLESRPEEYRKRFGARPRFKDDTDFLPLQAADLWVWFVRKWEQEGNRQKIENLDFGIWEHKRKPFPRIHITYTEEKLASFLEEVVKNAISRR